MMNISLVPTNLGIEKSRINLCDYRTYVLYKNGMFKTARRREAIALLKDGWHDNTKYQPNDEVLSYEEEWINGSTTRISGETNQDFSSTQRQHEESGSNSDSSCIGEEPRHEQHQSHLCNDGGKESNGSSVRAGSSSSKIKKTPGRRKRGE